MPNPSHCQAAFTNAIREEGSKKEACDHLQDVWDDLIAAKLRIVELEKELSALRVE